MAIAHPACVQCHGLGLKGGRLDAIQPCNCVLRAIFRICYEKFCKCATQERRLSRVTLDGAGAQCRRGVWGRKDEEYMADFQSLARRSLNEQEYRLFRMHFLLAANWRLCSEKLELDRGQFFHSVYRVEQKLGRAFRETKPYALYPVDEYYFGARETVASSYRLVPTVIPIRPPVRAVRPPRANEEPAAGLLPLDRAA